MVDVGVLGAEVQVAGEVVAGFVAFTTLAVTGIASWALVLLVRTTQLLARVEERTEDHDRRLEWLEHQHQDTWNRDHRREGDKKL